jgi:hypothetical protein
MVHSPKLDVINNDKHLTGISFTNGETICFGSLDFIVDHFGRLSLFDEGNVSGAIFVRIAHSGSPSLHTILEDSIDEGDTTSSGGGSSCFPISRECNMVTLAVLITTTPSSEGTLMPLAIATVRYGQPYHSQTPGSLLCNSKPIRRSNKCEPVLGRSIQSAGLRSSEANSSAVRQT